MHVGLCIATYRRPVGLRTLLAAVAELDWDGELTVVVADNDPQNTEGVAVAHEIAETMPWPVETVVVSQAGIPFPRNAAIDLALQREVDLIAFLDDDEWPPPGWLREMTRVLSLGADLVGGPQMPCFPDGTPDLLRSNRYYGHDQAVPDGELCVLQSSGNFIMRASTLQSLEPPWFDPRYARTSGADHDLFRRLDGQGAAMRWCRKGFVWEDIPAHRLDPAWMRERVIEIHNGRVRIDRRHDNRWRTKALRAAKSFALGLQASAATIIAGVTRSERRAYDAWLLRLKFTGKWQAHRGQKVDRKEDRPQPAPLPPAGPT